MRANAQGMGRTRENLGGMSTSQAESTASSPAVRPGCRQPVHRPAGRTARSGPSCSGLERLEAHARRLAAACVLAPPRRAGEPAAAPVRRERRGPGPGPPPDRRRGVDRGRGAGPRRRVARRQLPHRRGRPPRGPPGPAPGLRRGAAEARRPARSRGYPRVYALALALVAHTDSELDEAAAHAVRPRRSRRSPR